MTNITARYNGEFIVCKRTLIIALESENLTIQSVSFFLVDDQKTNTKGRNLFPQTGIRIIQENENNTRC